MKRLFPCILLATLSGCLEGELAHYSADFTHEATCTVSAGKEECFDPGQARASLQSRMSIDDRGNDTRVLYKEELLLGTYTNNVLKAGNTREQVREASGCLTRQQLEMEAVVDDPGFGLRREARGTLVERIITDGDPQQCGTNIPYGEVKRYRMVAVEVINP